jgi:hypothetical protein
MLSHNVFSPARVTFLIDEQSNPSNSYIHVDKLTDIEMITWVMANEHNSVMKE